MMGLLASNKMKTPRWPPQQPISPPQVPNKKHKLPLLVAMLPPRTPDKKTGSRPPRTIPKKWSGQHLHHHHDDNRSKGSSAADSHATPTSVLLKAGSPLTRDLSDLSGSYIGGNTINYPRRAASPSAVPVHVYPSDQSDTSYQRPWRHAHILSTRGPVHPQPRPDDENIEHTNSLDLFRRSRVMVGPQGLVEVVACRSDNSVASDSLDSTFNGSQARQRGGQPRIPLLILLMDPHRKIYEFEQLWIDVETDTVRDVLHAVQLSLSDRWRQDYDGLFQVRNQAFNQLIHILNVEKYGVLPLEVWVAKPWAMPAKTTIQYANSLLQHLTQLSVLAYMSGKEYPHSETYGKNGVGSHTTKDTEAILTFTKDAANRVHVPDGIMRHYHAHQFLSFTPPFEQGPKRNMVGVNTIVPSDDVESMISDIQTNSVGSFCGDSIDERRPVSPSSSVKTPEDPEGALLTDVLAVYSPVSEGAKPAIQPPRPVRVAIQPPRAVPSVTPAVPHLTTAARLASPTAVRQREQAVKTVKMAKPVKIDPKQKETRRSRFSQLFCCRSERETGNRRDGLQRNPTLETVPEWKPYWEEVSVGSAISDSRPLLLAASSDLHLSGRGNARTRSDWC